MKRKQVYLLLGIALLLVIAGTIFQMRQFSTWKGESSDRQIYPNLAVNDVTKVRVQAGKEILSLLISDDGWQVAERYGYPADFAKIRELLRSIWELKYVRTLEVGVSQFGRLQLLPPGQGDQSGTEIDLLGNGEKKIATLILGKRPSTSESAPGSGRFAFNPDKKAGKMSTQTGNFKMLPPMRVWRKKTPILFPPFPFLCKTSVRRTRRLAKLACSNRWSLSWRRSKDFITGWKSVALVPNKLTSCA